MMAAEPRIVSSIKRFTSRLEEFRDTGKPVNMNYATLSLTVGMSSMYANWQARELALRI